MSFDCTQMLLEYIMATENIYIAMNEDEIAELIKFSASNLLQFFNNALYIQEKGIPAYGKLIRNPQTFLTYSSISLQEEQINQMVCPAESQGEVAPIEFRCTKFQYNFVPGSQSSINFHTSLQETTTEDVFQSEIVQMILKYKWHLVKKYAFF